MITTEQTNIADMNIADLIREKRRLDEYLEENGDDDAADDRLDDVREAIDDILAEADVFGRDKCWRPVWNEEAEKSLLEGLSEDEEALVEDYLEGIFDEAVEHYEECASTLFVPRDRNIKCRDLAAKLEPCGIRVRRDAEEKSYCIAYEPGRTYEFEWENPPGVKHTKEYPVLEVISGFWKGRTGKLDYFKIDSDYLKDRDNQHTGADYILKAILGTCGDLLHGEEAAAVLVAQKTSAPYYWMTNGLLQRNMLIIEEDYVRRAIKEEKEAA
jgi:hypothetical protein